MARFTILVKPNARKDQVTRIDETTLEVRVSVPPVEGKANERVVELVAEFLGTRKRCVSIARGLTSRRKIVEVETS